MRSTIAVELKDKTIKQIYWHAGASPNKMINFLYDYYSNLDVLEKLVELGNISEFNKTLDTCKFYARDYNEELEIYNTHKNYEEYKEKYNGEEYNYLLKDKVWYCFMSELDTYRCNK